MNTGYPAGPCIDLLNGHGQPGKLDTMGEGRCARCGARYRGEPTGPGPGAGTCPYCGEIRGEVAGYGDAAAASGDLDDTLALENVGPPGIRADALDGQHLDDQFTPVAVEGVTQGTQAVAADPAARIAELPAPKGFFDNLPAPSATRPTRSKGRAPQLSGKTAAPPPARDFFDDLPTAVIDPSRPPPRSAATSEPKGRPDDLPGPLVVDSAHKSAPPAPKGFFDDLPGPAVIDSGPRSAPRAPNDPLDELPASGASQPDRDAPDQEIPDRVSAIESGAEPHRGNAHTPSAAFDLEEMELPHGQNHAATAPRQRLKKATGPALAKPSDLPPTSGAASAAPVLTVPPTPTAREPAGPLPRRDGLQPHGDSGSESVDLMLETSPVSPAKTGAAPPPPSRAAGQERLALDPRAVSRRQRRPAAPAEQRDAPLARAGRWRKHRVVAALASAAAIAATSIVAVHLWGAHRAQRDRAARAADAIARAEGELLSDAPQHWERAMAAAAEALTELPDHGEAAGMAAQARYAAYLDGSPEGGRLLQAARAYDANRTQSGDQGPHARKADALRHVADHQPEPAIRALSTYTADAGRGDANAWLYLGWACAAGQQHREAIAAFERALTLSPERIPALYGLGRAALASGAPERARRAFAATQRRNEVHRGKRGYRDHLGALLGLLQVKTHTQALSPSAREQDYLGILRRKDIAQADPRAAALAWTLAAELALHAGRVEEARRRYRQALERDRHNLAALVGVARADLVQGRVEEARTALEKVLASDDMNLDAALSLAEVETAAGRQTEAQALLDAFWRRDPESTTQGERVRAHIAQASLWEGESYDRAVAEYERAAHLMRPEEDVRPTVLLARALGRHPEAAQRRRGVALLAPLEERAKQEPEHLAATLGLAYASLGEDARAEEWFRRALAANSEDVETRFQLGLVLYRQRRVGDAIGHIRAAYDRDRDREDIGLELALIYERFRRDKDAAELYERLVAAPKPSVGALARAGRFFSRTGDWNRARALGQQLAEQDERHPAALFLRGEALFRDGQYAAAARLFRQAAESDGAAQYYDALGRALERVQPPVFAAALEAYERATSDAGYLSPRLGIARIRILTGQHREARAALDEIVALEPDNAWALFHQGESYRETGDLRQAVALYEQSLRYAPKEFAVIEEHGWTTLPAEEARAVTYYHLGLSHYDGGRPHDAVGALRRATATWEETGRQQGSQPARPPWLSEAYRILGYAERARGHDSEAATAWQHYLDQHPPEGAESQEVRRLLLRVRAR